MARKTPKTKTITSRSFSLSTGGFSLDFKWRKVEITEESQDVSPLRGHISPPKRENFAQVLERKQITNLVAPANEDISPYRTLPISLAPLRGPSNSQVINTYNRARRQTADPDKDDYV